MEVRQLQIFRTLADELNFTRTAEKVHTVQSNVTAQIRALEEELGVPLFDRLGRRVTLTDAGRRFQPFAEKALAAMELGQLAIRAGSEPSGPLRIGAPESILTYRLPPILRTMRQRYPHVEISFRPHLSETMGAELESGKLDLIICMCDAVSNPAIAYVALPPEKIVLVGQPNHPLAKKSTVRPTDLEGQTLLLTEPGCGYRNKLDRVFAMQNIRPGNITEFSSVEALKQCVAANMGIGLLPEIVVACELRQGQLKTLTWKGPSLDIGTHILWHKDKWISPAMEAFTQILKKALDRPPRRAQAAQPPPLLQYE
jgi:DNA-binding transcriptional LysR family regulator